MKSKTDSARVGLYRLVRRFLFSGGSSGGQVGRLTDAISPEGRPVGAGEPIPRQQCATLVRYSDEYLQRQHYIDPVRRAVCPKCNGTDSRVDSQPWAEDDRFTCPVCGWVGGLSETLVESDSRAFNRRMTQVVRKILSANNPVRNAGESNLKS